ncbi:hypothetical protein GIB67_014262 [Kingdonia uniflora]|uniref:Pentatricopeptide repeat-containing protein n=1 Tax=Kingdonia uniflora TaxID=39325 RepID=A0A7J7M1Z3_9MAGN|nr:hypothetical protein GIB67_014262 [Kingdonia uniflora]
MISSKTRTIFTKPVTQSHKIHHPPIPQTKNCYENRPRKPPNNLKLPIPFLKDLKSIQNPDSALRFFEEHRKNGFKHDYPSYSALIYRLTRARNFEAVETILGYIKHVDLRCKDILFIAVIQHFGKWGLVDKAIELFNGIPSFNCVRTVQLFNMMLNVLVDNDRFDDAGDVLRRGSKMGFRPNVVSFNIIMKGCVKKGEWEETCKVFEEMLERGIQPSVVTYNILIGFLSKKGDLGKAMKLLGDMREKGNCPNVVTYAILMEGLCSVGRFDDAKKMMFDMEYQGCKSGMVNFGVLMNDLAKNGKIDEARGLLVEMKRRHFKPDVVSYNILINYMCKESRALGAYKIFVEMQVEGYVPNSATYRMMVDGFCKVGEFERGLQVLNAMLTSGHWPRVETFCCLIVGLSEQRKLSEAGFVIEEMLKRNMEVELGAWEVLARSACAKDGVTADLVTELVTMT